MALIKCLGCGKDISDKAQKCPKCGWVPGSKMEGVPTNDNSEELSGMQERNIRLKDELIKVENKLLKLNEKTKEIENLRELNAQLNIDKKNLENQLKEATCIDNTDRELLFKLQNDNELLQKENQKLKKINVDLLNHDKKLINDSADRPINIIVDRKILTVGLICGLVIIILAVCVNIFALTSVLKNELNTQNVTDQGNKGMTNKNEESNTEQTDENTDEQVNNDSVQTEISDEKSDDIADQDTMENTNEDTDMAIVNDETENESLVTEYSSDNNTKVGNLSVDSSEHTYHEATYYLTDATVLEVDEESNTVKIAVKGEVITKSDSDKIGVYFKFLDNNGFELYQKLVHISGNVGVFTESFSDVPNSVASVAMK